MSEIDLAARYRRQVFLKYAKPVSYVPTPSPNAIALQAVQQQSGSSASELAQFVTRTARPDTRAVFSEVVSLEKGGALALRPAQAAAQVAARRTATQILMSPASVSSARELASNVVERVPVVSRVLTRAAPVLGRFAGPLAVVNAITLIPSVLELFKDPVHDWLTGGWRGDGKQKANLSYPAGTPGGRAVPYRVKWERQNSDGCTLTNIETNGPNGEVWNGPVYYRKEVLGYASLPCVQGQAAIVGHGFDRPSYSDRVGGGINVPQVPGVYFKYSIIPLDGVDETGPNYQAAPTVTPAAIAQDPTKIAPTETPKSPTDAARNAALAAVLGTIAAGKLKLNPPSARDALKTPQKRYGTQLAPSPTETGPATNPCKGNACGGANLDATKGNADKLDDLLQYLQALGIGDIKKTVDRIDTKMGAQIVDERGVKIGVGGMLKNVFEKVNKVGDYLHFDRITNVLTLAATIHNATMLSNQLEQTLAQALSSALAVIGIKDSEGNQLDINKVVGKSIESVIKGAIGAQNYTELTTNWKKANRIYQAGANLIGSVQSLRYSIMGALDTIGSMNAKMANALKKFGVVGDSGYGWFNPTPNFDNRFMRGLETAENVVSNIDNIASEVLSAQETVTQIGTQKTELETAVKDGLEKRTVENVQQKDKATAAKTASKSPDIVSDNLIKPES
jgi:hypothetical protein